MKRVGVALALLLLPAAAIREAPRAHGSAKRHPLEGRPRPVTLAAKAAPPANPSVNETNMLATQSVTLYHQEDCGGDNATFNSSGNAFLADFGRFAGRVWSVRLCGKGTFFYYSSPDMQRLSLLGHITRCGDEVTKSMDDCDCQNMRPEVRKLVESFSLQYC